MLYFIDKKNRNITLTEVDYIFSNTALSIGSNLSYIIYFKKYFSIGDRENQNLEDLMQIRNL